MPIEKKRSYSFSFITGAIIALCFVVFLWFTTKELALNFGFYFKHLCFVFFISALVIQLRIESFIYIRVKKIYDHLILLEPSIKNNDRVTTDLSSLLKDVEDYAQDKRMEIDTLKIQEEYRREFLGNISHELKTPLFTVQGYLLTLLEGGMNDKSIRQKYLERAEKGVERLVYIVKDLDMITRFEAGVMQVHKTTFNLVELVQNVLDLLEMRADKKGIMLMLDRKYTKSIPVHADKEKIQQVLTNLIENSIKYGVEGGTTEISIEDLTDNKYIIRVTDNGQGIEKQHIPRLFERFYRVDKSGNRKQGGSGLGLAIVKHIIEAHNEHIYVESEIKKGSEFSFTLEKRK